MSGLFGTDEIAFIDGVVAACDLDKTGEPEPINSNRIITSGDLKSNFGNIVDMLVLSGSEIKARKEWWTQTQSDESVDQERADLEMN